MTTTTNITDIIVAGAIAEGHGALAGWSGLGSLTRADILACLEQAGLSATLAPAAKSDVGHAGNALGALNNLGFISRRAGKAAWRRNGFDKARPYRARWTVLVTDAAQAQLGEAAGRVVLTAELHDGSSDLIIETHHEDLAAQIQARYLADRDAETYSAGDVTSWLSRTLVNVFGAARFAVGYFVPPAHRAPVEQLCSALAARWGSSWICPLLPVADSNELRSGLARGFTDEIARVERSVANLVEKNELTEAAAARFLRELAETDARADAYRALCGDAVMAEPAARLRALSEQLRDVATDAAVRFALLDLSGPAAAERIAAAPAPRLSPAEKAAERALAERIAAQVETAAPVEAPVFEADPDTAARFALLDLDDDPRVEAPADEPSSTERPLDLGPGLEPEPVVTNPGQADIVITIADNRLRVSAPYSQDALSAWRNLPGRRWNKAHKTNDVPLSSREELFQLLRSYYPGATAIGPKGAFII